MLFRNIGKKISNKHNYKPIIVHIICNRRSHVMYIKTVQNITLLIFLIIMMYCIVGTIGKS